MGYLTINSFESGELTDSFHDLSVDLPIYNSEISQLYETCFQLATKYRDYTVAREQSSEYRFSVEQIAINAMGTDEYKISKIISFCEQLGIEHNIEIIDKLMQFHFCHRQKNISIFDLKKHPSLIRNEMKELRILTNMYGINQELADDLYRVSVDSGVLGSMEELEKVKSWSANITDINDFLTSFTKISLAGFAIYIFKSEKISIDTLFELLELGEIVKKHSTEYIAQVFFVLCVFVPTFTKETLEHVKKYFEKKEKALTTKIEQLTYLHNILQDDIYKSIPQAIRSCESIDQLFTDVEIEDLYELLKEKNGNNNDILKLKYIIEEGMDQTDVDPYIIHTINSICKKVYDSNIYFITQLFQRRDKRNKTDTALILEDILDNLNHIENYKSKSKPIKHLIKKMKL